MAGYCVRAGGMVKMRESHAGCVRLGRSVCVCVPRKIGVVLKLLRIRGDYFQYWFSRNKTVSGTKECGCFMHCRVNLCTRLKYVGRYYAHDVFRLLYELRTQGVHHHQVILSL